jgi:hypothetical protein
MVFAEKEVLLGLKRTNETRRGLQTRPIVRAVQPETFCNAASLHVGVSENFPLRLFLENKWSLIAFHFAPRS